MQRDYSASLREAERTHLLMEAALQAPTAQDYLTRVAELLRDWTGCRCVGVRILQPDGRIPYEVHQGFSQEFWQQENFLSVKSDPCACTRAVLGAPEPQDRRVITPYGSFHSPDMDAFLRSLPPEEQARFRGRCIAAGFRTVVVIPVRHGERTVGAIHLADERPGRVSRRTVEFLETLCPLIGEAYEGLLWPGVSAGEGPAE